MRGGRRLALGLAALALTTISGCGSNELESPTAVRLGKLSGFYLEYAIANNRKGPGNDQALKKQSVSLASPTPRWTWLMKPAFKS
jgi:hypothetical protein